MFDYTINVEYYLLCNVIFTHTKSTKTKVFNQIIKNVWYCMEPLTNYEV